MLMDFFSLVTCVLGDIFLSCKMLFSGSLNVKLNAIFFSQYCSRMHEIVLHKYAGRIPL